MITAAQMVRIDERTGTREAVGEPSEADDLEVLNDYLSASIILDELQGWDPYTHALVTPEGTYYHVTMSPDSSTPTQQHTPGPWELITRTVKAQNGPDYVMCDVLAPNPDAGKQGVSYSGSHFSIAANLDCEADARLIASAPALLAALEAIVQGIDNGFSRYEMGAALHELRSIAAPAIEEARCDA